MWVQVHTYVTILLHYSNVDLSPLLKGIEKYTKVKNGGYTTIGNVRNPLDLRPRDMMESFLLGETFTYLYLLFADDAGRSELPLDRWVINTEAHPVPMHPN